jgi:hypothetical protein
MKKLLFLFLVLNYSSSFASGDGTLPVLESVKIDFLDSGPGLNMALPDCVVFKINRPIRNREGVTKKIRLKKANLEQTVNLSNRNGRIDVQLKSKDISNQRPIKSIRRDLNQTEFMNEINLNNETVIQHIQINTAGNGNCLMK